METLLKQFDSFLKRAILPISVLVSVLLLFQYKECLNTNKKNCLEQYIHNPNNEDYLLILFIIILVIALSFIMKILIQLFFDNFLKKNFNSFIFYCNENYTLKVLRLKSIQKLKKENHAFNDIEMTDFLLYQVIGRKLQFVEHPTNTKRYIDDAKSAGSIFIAIIIAIIIKSYLYESYWGLFLIPFMYFIALEYIISKYRSRAIRMYTNYLIGENYPI
ncbi:MAG: Unknown protein [uncultured Sulfurovum sp.]|uniref:Uncharacterized protein n=1 Tax=uncultured Sulfurovum sp. TaxID=269237 RepID=A0A6S6SP34_9BACT|nr:MAG: Unknown protein [uncultured Sulfurovum sp.]